MNSLPTNLNSSKPLNTFSKTEKNEISPRDSGKENKSDNIPQRSKKPTDAAKVSIKKEVESPSTDPGKPLSESKDTKEYLEVISRLEKKLSDNDFQDEDLEKVIKSLEKRLLGLSADQKKRLLQMEFFKALKIKNFNAMKDSLFEVFSNKKTWQKGVEFLKSDQLISILLDQENGTHAENKLDFDFLKEPKVESYTPKGAVLSAQNNLTSGKPTSIKA